VPGEPFFPFRLPPTVLPWQGPSGAKSRSLIGARPAKAAIAMSAFQSYNPIIIGFVEGEGYVNIPLETAREDYGQFPSEYGLLPIGEGRRVRKALNLSLGLSLIKLLQERPALSETIAKFYERWGRDFRADFHVSLEPFHRRNDPAALRRIVATNGETLAACRDLEAAEYLRRHELMSLSTLRSIPADDLLVKTKAILTKKRRNPAHAAERDLLDRALALVQAKEILAQAQDLTGGDITQFGAPRLGMHADQIADLLWGLSRHVPLAGVDTLDCVRGQGIEFAFTPRDASFLELGKEVGDCTADKYFRQVDREVENIYWTVFAWFLDRNYQILRVLYDGELVMKVHLLPVLVSNSTANAVLLALDAVETTPAFREDTRASNPSLLERKEHIFSRMLDEVRRLARQMGISYVYAERFSNTAWIRRELAQFPEVYVPIAQIWKIDELEDVFELAKRICAAAGEEAPSSVFMELQMKNTFLQAAAAGSKGTKPFAVIAGDKRLGIPMKRVVGV
jgi:hypothetical protein